MTDGERFLIQSEKANQESLEWTLKPWVVSYFGNDGLENLSHHRTQQEAEKERKLYILNGYDSELLFIGKRVQ